MLKSLAGKEAIISDFGHRSLRIFTLKTVESLLMDTCIIWMISLSWMVLFVPNGAILTQFLFL